MCISPDYSLLPDTGLPRQWNKTEKEKYTDQERRRKTVFHYLHGYLKTLEIQKQNFKRGRDSLPKSEEDEFLLQ